MNKEICKYCMETFAGNWDEGYEEEWKRGFVSCFDKPIRASFLLLENNPYMKCSLQNLTFDEAKEIIDNKKIAIRRKNGWTNSEDKKKSKM